MSILVFLGGLMFLLLPTIRRSQFSFVDLYLIFCLYYDIMDVFGEQPYFLSQHILFLVFSIYYLFLRMKSSNRYLRNILLVTLLFLGSFFLFPLFKNVSVKNAFIDFSINYSSIFILPIAVHYYSTKGNIVNLFKAGYFFILFWVGSVVFFTLFKIDVREGMGHMGSRGFGGSVFYFGNLGFRGAITYISFSLLLIPVALKFLPFGRKVSLLGSAGFVMTIMFLALKRYSFVTIILGFLNYFIKKSISVATKVKLIAASVAVLVLLFFVVDIQSIVQKRYEARGAADVYSAKAVEEDIRVYEPVYVWNYVSQGSTFDILFGKNQGRAIDINTKKHKFKDWQVHNQYAEYLLRFGFLGLIFYLILLISIYRIAYKLKRNLKTRNILVDDYWIVLQNFIVLFIIAGMVGGHVHITFRAMIMIYSGGIIGYFIKTLQNNTMETKRASVAL